MYAEMYPAHLDRFVLDSAMAPDDYGMRMIQAMGPANERAPDDLAAWAAPRHATYRLGRTPAVARATVEGLVRRAAHRPIAIGGYRIDEQTLPFLLYFLGTDDRDNTQYAATLRLLVTVPVRAHAVFVDYPDACANEAVNDYLLKGVLPADDVGCERDAQAARTAPTAPITPTTGRAAPVHRSHQGRGPG
ncbi:alpha/beta hydrolase [Streptomyces sp. NPDC059452]|uniref:alpha/beta hydrolase n=1 Tax=Streptomyces sp. NPDC059452 TaxID=3346835 RepID=UPI00368C039A